MSSCGKMGNMTERKEYTLKLKINDRHLSKVVIDQHYQLKHPDINDDLILELVKTINNTNWPIEE